MPKDDHAHGCLNQCLSSMDTGLLPAGGHSVGTIRITNLLFLCLCTMIERVGLGFCIRYVSILGRSLYVGAVFGVQVEDESLPWMTVL